MNEKNAYNRKIPTKIWDNRKYGAYRRKNGSKQCNWREQGVKVKTGRQNAEILIELLKNVLKEDEKNQIRGFQQNEWNIMTEIIGR